MRPTLIALLVCLAATPAMAKPTWTQLGASETNSVFYGNLNTVRAGSYKGQSTIRVDGKQTHANGSQDLFIWEVSRADCARGHGVIWQLDMSGRSLHRNDFSYGVNSVASGVAQKICRLGG